MFAAQAPGAAMPAPNKADSANVVVRNRAIIIASQRLEVLDDRQTLVLGQVITVGVAAVALPRPRRVIDLAPLELGHVCARRLLQYLDLPADPERVIVLFAGAVRAREHLR